MNRTLSITFGLAFGLSLAACSSMSSSTPQPATSADYEDTAQTIASSTAMEHGGAVDGGDIIAMSDAVSIALGRMPLGFVLGRDGHIHGNRMGIDNSFAITCKDAAGTALATCDKTTDSATVVLKWTGSVQTPNFSSSVDREGTWTITGLQSATATVNGDSSFSLDTTLTSIFHQGVTSTATFDFTASYDAIQIATQPREITGGSASFEVKAHRTVTGTAMGSNDVDKSFDIHAVLTFNGDRTATLVLDGTQTFTIDLRSGRVSHAK